MLRRCFVAAVFRPCVSLFCDPGGGPIGRPVRRWGRLKGAVRGLSAKDLALVLKPTRPGQKGLRFAVPFASGRPNGLLGW
jgi:hypothetical protein